MSGAYSQCHDQVSVGCGAQQSQSKATNDPTDTLRSATSAMQGEGYSCSPEGVAVTRGDG